MRAATMRDACAVLAAVALLAAPAAARLILEEMDEELERELAEEMDQEMADEVKQMRDVCHAETGVDLSLVDKVNGGADLMPDPSLKCYIKCVMERARLLPEGGVVDVEAAVALLPPELGEKNAAALRACGVWRGTDDCDTAYLTQVCWQNANKADYFLI